MRENDPRRHLKVGLFAAALLALLAVSILVIGSKQGLFVRHVRYHSRFAYVGGLGAGAPVHLNGVAVGDVVRVDLPTDPAQRETEVTFRVEARVARRIRSDSEVRIRSLGLLGDRYLEISGGSPTSPQAAAGALLRSQELTDVSAMLSQGGDVVGNVLAISTSLRAILERVERGEGVLGELTRSPEAGGRLVEHMGRTLEHAEAILGEVRSGRGTLGRLLKDPELEARLVDDLAGFVRAGRSVAESVERDLASEDSLLAGMLRDPQGSERLARALAAVTEAASAAAAAGRNLAEGRGTLGHLLNDEAYAQLFLEDLAALTRSLRSVAAKIDNGEGSAGRFVNDPQLYEDLENVVRGVGESRLATWAVRNRREAGEKAAATPAPKE
jgi:phospholipid/cholesterol/gamma-HCH transport system substrate-binding protein